MANNHSVQGLEIAAGPDGGLRLTGAGRGETFLAASVNESVTGETVSQSIHEVSELLQQVSGGSRVSLRSATSPEARFS